MRNQNHSGCFCVLNSSKNKPLGWQEDLATMTPQSMWCAKPSLHVCTVKNIFVMIINKQDYAILIINNKTSSAKQSAEKHWGHIKRFDIRFSLLSQTVLCWSQDQIISNSRLLAVITSSSSRTFPTCAIVTDLWIIGNITCIIHYVRILYQDINPFSAGTVFISHNLSGV